MTPIVQDVAIAAISVIGFGLLAKILWAWISRPTPRASNGFITQGELDTFLLRHREGCRELLQAQWQVSAQKGETARQQTNIRLKRLEESQDALIQRIDEVLKICTEGM